VRKVEYAGIEYLNCIVLMVLYAPGWMDLSLVFYYDRAIDLGVLSGIGLITAKP